MHVKRPKGSSARFDRETNKARRSDSARNAFEGIEVVPENFGKGPRLVGAMYVTGTAFLILAGIGLLTAHETIEASTGIVVMIWMVAATNLILFFFAAYRFRVIAHELPDDFYAESSDKRAQRRSFERAAVVSFERTSMLDPKDANQTSPQEPLFSTKIAKKMAEEANDPEQAKKLLQEAGLLDSAGKPIARYR